MRWRRHESGLATAAPSPLQTSGGCGLSLRRLASGATRWVSGWLSPAQLVHFAQMKIICVRAAAGEGFFVCRGDLQGEPLDYFCRSVEGSRGSKPLSSSGELPTYCRRCVFAASPWPPAPPLAAATPRMESGLFFKLCKECWLLNEGLTPPHVDLTFSKVLPDKVRKKKKEKKRKEKRPPCYRDRSGGNSFPIYRDCPGEAKLAWCVAMPPW